MVIETGFAKRNDPRIFGELAQRCHHIFACFLGIGRMNADHREDARILLRKIDSPPAAFDRRADGDDASDVSFGCATQYFLKIIREIRIIKVRVRFDQHGHC